MPVFRRLRQALGIKVEEKFDDESIPVNTIDRIFWVPFGARYYRQARQRAWLLPLLVLFLVVTWMIGSLVASWVYCAECRACRLAIPEGKCGTVLSMDQVGLSGTTQSGAFTDVGFQGDLFCLRSGWTGFSPRLGEAKALQGRVYYRHPQDVSHAQETVMGLKSDWPCLRKLMAEFYFPGGFTDH